MITFSDVKRTGEKTIFFVPEPLKALILHRLKKANIPYESINWRKIPENMKTKQDETRQLYESKGYVSTTCIGAIISDVDPTDMFNKSLLFFGDTIDPDYKKQKEECDKRSWQNYLNYYSKLPGIPVGEINHNKKENKIKCQTN